GALAAGVGREDPGGREAAVDVVVVVVGDPELLQVVDALDPPGGLARGLDRGGQQSDEDGDDRDDDQQLEQRERSSETRRHGRFLPRSVWKGRGWNRAARADRPTPARPDESPRSLTRAGRENERRFDEDRGEGRPGACRRWAGDSGRDLGSSGPGSLGPPFPMTDDR